MTDIDALVRDARAGDRRAMEDLLRSQHERVRAVTRRLCRDETDAADATQEALIAIVRGLPRFDGRAAFSTWVYRIATNAALDEIRRRRRRPDPGLSAIEPSSDEPDLSSTVADRMAIDAALARLPDEFRVAVVLRDQVGLDYAEIAEVLGVPPGTVRSRIARGRAGLAAILGNQQPTSPRQTPSHE